MVTDDASADTVAVAATDDEHPDEEVDNQHYLLAVLDLTLPNSKSVVQPVVLNCSYRLAVAIDTLLVDLDALVVTIDELLDPFLRVSYPELLASRVMCNVQNRYRRICQDLVPPTPVFMFF